MPRPPVRGTRLAGALLLALILPVAAQSPAPDPSAAAEAEVPADVPAEAPAEAPAEPVAEAAEVDTNDPSQLESERQPRASRSLLLDLVRTSAGYFTVGERGHILISDDASTWRQATVPTRSTLTALATADGQLWAAGHDGVIVHSADGGQTWVRRRASPWRPDLADTTEGVPILDLMFTDASNGFAIGAYNLMLVTSDGGVTWTPRSLGGAAADPAPAPAADPAAEETIAAEGDDWTFNQDELSLDAESDPHLNAIARAGSGALVITGERGTFMRSRDGGQTWENRRLPYEGSMFGVLSWEDDHILVFGLRGNVYESTDLGTSWTRVETGIGTSLMGGHALPDGGAILVGGNGAVLYRPDSASPFTATAYATATGETPMLSGVLPASDGSFLLIGDKGANLYRPQ